MEIIILTIMGFVSTLIAIKAGLNILSELNYFPNKKNQKDSQGEVTELKVKTNVINQLQIATARLAETTSDNVNYIETLSTEVKKIADKTSETIEAQDSTINLTVEEILKIRETLVTITEKTKQLAESSQKISEVVNLISSFSAQTNLLALNASIEATRAGEQGTGFAIVAEEIRNLATQSTQANAQIENIVKNIQLETEEIIAEMETGNEQVIIGTKLINETRQNLNQITTISIQVNQMIKNIAAATVQQSKTSEMVNRTITDVALFAENTVTTQVEEER